MYHSEGQLSCAVLKSPKQHLGDALDTTEPRPHTPEKRQPGEVLAKSWRTLEQTISGIRTAPFEHQTIKSDVRRSFMLPGAVDCL